MQFAYSKFQKGLANWKCPPYLLDDKDFNDIIIGTIQQTIADHINTELVSKELFLATNNENLVHLPSSAAPDTLLEIVIGSCRDATIKYTAAKNAIRNREKKTVEDNLTKASG